MDLFKIEVLRMKDGYGVKKWNGLPIDMRMKKLAQIKSEYKESRYFYMKDRSLKQLIRLISIFKRKKIKSMATAQITMDLKAMEYDLMKAKEILPHDLKWSELSKTYDYLEKVI